ncbi:MAG TPA: PA14 domain-containing protein [Planctomycetaceae bacterium]|nr:PA14 domain-containing protein [Planctomycetaceae bacterium]
MSAFDPYHKWLGIPAGVRPPTHYRLLGLEVFESDPDVIDAAANRQMSYLKQVSTGAHAAESQKLLAEIAAARVCLLNPAKKSAYDERLKSESQPTLVGPEPVGPLLSSPPRPARKRAFPMPLIAAAAVVGLMAAVGVWKLAFGTRSRVPNGVDNTQVATVTDSHPKKAQRQNEDDGPVQDPASHSQPPKKPPVSRKKPALQIEPEKTPMPDEPPPATVVITPTPPAEDVGDRTEGPGVLSQKEPIPPSSEVAAAQQKIREVFESEIKGAKSPAAKVEIARRMLSQADDRKNELPTVYALQMSARDLAAESGEVPTAFEAIDQLTAMFEVDPGRLREEALEAAAHGAKFSNQRTAVSDAALELAETAISEDDFATADRFAKIALTAARGASDATLAKRTAARVKEIDEQKQAFEELQADLKQLETDPDNPDANLRVGRFECFSKDDWEAGLPRLAKSSDAGLKQLALRELQNSTDPKEQLALADAWDQLAEKAQGPTREALDDHAEQWYRRAVGQLSGIEKLRVEKKLAAADKVRAKREASGPQKSSLKPGLVAEYFSDLNFQTRAFARLDRMVAFHWGKQSPHPSLPIDYFSVRWHGYLRTPKPGKYTLVMVTDDGCRVTLDGKQIINNLNVTGSPRAAVEIELTDKPHALEIEYRERFATAWCHLRWSRQGKFGFREQPIGPQFLFHSRAQEKINTAVK